MNTFINAAMQKLRYQSPRGLLTTEDLFDLNLTNLDEVAKTIDKKLRDHQVSFISSTPINEIETLKLSVVLSVIEHTQEQLTNAKDASKRAERKSTILDALAEKEVDELKSKSAKELKRELKSL